MNQAPRTRTPVVTVGAPHARDAIDVAGIMRGTAWALIPCLLAGAHGTGRQIHLALGEDGLAAAGWRGDVLAALSFTADPTSMVGCTLHGLLYALPTLALCLVVASGWERVFARVRDRPLVPGAFLVAFLFTLALPVTLHWWQAAIALSFGVVLGKEIFGGTGRNIVHPAVAAVVFLILAWPESMRGDAVWVPVAGALSPTPYDQATAGGVAALDAAGITWTRALLGGQPGPLGASSPLACLLGTAVLIGRRLLAWRTVVAVFVGVIVGAWVLGGLGLGAGAAAAIPGHWHLVLGSIVFGAIFLAADPVTSPMTDAGRWIHGLLLGGVVVMIRTGNPAHPEGTYLALLLGSIFAPMNDSVVVWAHTRWRDSRD